MGHPVSATVIGTTLAGPKSEGCDTPLVISPGTIVTVRTISAMSMGRRSTAYLYVAVEDPIDVCCGPGPPMIAVGINASGAWPVTDGYHVTIVASSVTLGSTRSASGHATLRIVASGNK